MQIVKLPKDVKSITVLRAGTPVTIYEAKTKRKKQSRQFRGFEKLARRVNKAQVASATTYGKRHARSNRKRKDGWLRDLTVNVARAGKDGRKKLRIVKLLGL